MLGVKLIRMVLLLSVMLNPGWAQERSRSSMYLEELKRVFTVNVLAEDAFWQKCASPLIMRALSQPEKLMPSEYVIPSGRIVRSLQEKSRLSPSGRFRIHYDTTGTNTPALLDPFNQPIPNSHEAYVDSVAKYFDLSWAFMVDSLKYAAPPLEDTGGVFAYNVYIEAQPTGFFGFTTPDSTIDSTGLYRSFTSFITIDNDFGSTRTKGMDGLKITAVHEFFHAIQLGVYGVWVSESDPLDIDRDFYFYELSAVWLEDMLFSEVNDYINDISTYLNGFRDAQGHSLSFVTEQYPGYERSLWAHFLATRFGDDMIRQTWEAIHDAPFLISMERVLRDRNTTFAGEFVTFSQWNYQTGSRADTLRFYPEGHLYPEYTPNVARTYDPSGTMSLFFSGYPLSTQYCLFSNATDSTISVVVNVDIENAYTGSASLEQFEINLSSTTPSMPYQNLRKGLKVGFGANSPTHWRVRHLEFTTGSNASVSSGPFPNPVRIDETSRVSLPVATFADEAEVFFVSSSLDLVFSRNYPVSDDLGGRYIHVPTNDFRSSVSSGVYFIVVHSQDAEYKWKVAVIR